MLGHSAQEKTFAPAKNTFHVIYDNLPTCLDAVVLLDFLVNVHASMH
jgi:hypothetical protein